jgi:flagellar motor switch protein FliN/FliY
MQSTLTPSNGEAHSSEWASSIAEFLQRVTSRKVQWKALAAEESAAKLSEAADGGLWLRFFAGKAGEEAFLLSAPDALHLLQQSGNAPKDATSGLTDEGREILKDFFWQITATLMLPAGATEFEFAGFERPSWPSAYEQSSVFFSENGELFTLHHTISAEFLQALVPAQSKTDTTPALSGRSAGHSVPDSHSKATPIRDSNLDLLLDVDLDVTLRFGQRNLLLRDVLNLGPGTVVELDQLVQDPVELVVGQKVVAWGEVVTVDGNYGLRVTGLASQQERLESLGH